MREVPAGSKTVGGIGCGGVRDGGGQGAVVYWGCWLVRHCFAVLIGACSRWCRAMILGSVGGDMERRETGGVSTVRGFTVGRWQPRNWMSSLRGAVFEFAMRVTHAGDR